MAPAKAASPAKAPRTNQRREGDVTGSETEDSFRGLRVTSEPERANKRHAEPRRGVRDDQVATEPPPLVVLGSFAYLDSTRPSGLATPVSAFCASCQAESPG